MTYDAQAHRRIDELEQILNRISHLSSIEVPAPLYKDETRGIGLVIGLDESLLSQGVTSINGDPTADAIITYDEVITLETGTPENGVYSALVQPRVDGAFTDGALVWVEDLAGSASLPTGEPYPAQVVRDAQDVAVSEARGPYFMSLAAGNTGHALDDPLKWLQVTGPISPVVWDIGTEYAIGNLVSHAGQDWIAQTDPAIGDEPGFAADWLIVVPLASGGYYFNGTYTLGGYVQEVRPLFAIRSTIPGIQTINGDGTPDQLITSTDLSVTIDNSVPGTTDLSVAGGGATPTFITSPATGTATGPAFTAALTASGSDVTLAAAGSTLTVNVPNAGAAARGVVTTGAQNFAGDKVFQGSVTAIGTVFSGVYHGITGAALSAGLFFVDNTTSSQTMLTGNAPTYELRFIVSGFPIAFIFGATSASNGDYPPTVMIQTDNTGSAFATGQTATVSGLQFTSGWYTGGSFSGGTGTVTGITGDAGTSTGLTIGVTGTSAVPILTLGGITKPSAGGLGADASAYTGLPIFTAGIVSDLTNTRGVGTDLELKIGADRWVRHSTSNW